MSIPRETLARYVTPGCTFVETGARWGDRLVAAWELGARLIYSCEIDGLMCDIGRRHVADAIRGDVLCQIFYEQSEAMLSKISPVPRNAVVFLDAHTETTSPILAELAILTLWSPKPDIILIDDVRLFRSRQWGVSLDQVLAAVAACGNYAISFDAGIQAEDVLVAKRGS